MSKLILKRYSNNFSLKSPGFNFKAKVDGLDMGHGYGQKEIDLNAGKHTISVLNLLGNSNTLEIELKDGETLEVIIYNNNILKMFVFIICLFLLSLYVLSSSRLHYFDQGYNWIPMVAFISIWLIVFFGFRKDFLLLVEKK